MIRPPDQAIATVLVPARGEEVALPVTLPRIVRAAAAALGPSPEVVLLVSDGVWERELSALAREHGVAYERVGGPGKFAALRAGAESACTPLLLLVDADVVPAEDAFQRVLAPLISGSTDVCAGHARAYVRPVDGVASVLQSWAVVSTDAWNRLRTCRADLRWALPGTLYALRRELFPSAVLVPTVEDACVGLHVRDLGGRLGYDPEAVVDFLAPATYRDWVTQKLRIRRGWAALAGVRPHDVDELWTGFAPFLSEAMHGVRSAPLMRLQDGCLRAVARFEVASKGAPPATWDPVASTKLW